MHELSIALAIVEAAQEEAGKQNASRVNRVDLRIGPLSGVVKDALLFSYQVSCQDTLLAGSQLVIEDVAPAVFCETCGRESEIETIQVIRCPLCNGDKVTIIRGRELEFVSMEIEHEEDGREVCDEFAAATG